jgi:hypothetical protein
MISVSEIQQKIGELASQRIEAAAFERWFRKASRNFHQLPSGQLKHAIFAIEAVFSEYHFANLEESALARELAEAIRPFCTIEPSYAAVEIRYGEPSWGTSTAGNSFVWVLSGPRDREWRSGNFFRANKNTEISRPEPLHADV